MPVKVEPDFKVTPDPNATGESVGTTKREASKEMKELAPGSKPVLGYIGAIPPSMVVEEVVAEKLTPEEQLEKKSLKLFLSKVLQPPFLSSKANPNKPMLVLQKKLSKMTLGELRRFWAKAVPENNEITLEDQELVQSKWDEVSP